MSFRWLLWPFYRLRVRREIKRMTKQFPYPGDTSWKRARLRLIEKGK